MPPVQPLTGFRVVDLSSYFSGPFATLHLADLGADVVKVEGPLGDPYRRFGIMRKKVSIGFANINRGKRSIVLDLTIPEDLSSLFALVKDADVLLANWRPGVADKLGITDAALLECNPRLVHAWITGYGQDGPSAKRPAFDAIVQGQSGLAFVEGAGGQPRVLQTFIADKVASLMAAQAVLAALLARERTGKGARLDVSLLDALAYFDFPDMMATRTVVDEDVLEAPWAPPTMVRTRDGYLIVAPSKGRQVRAACAAAGHPEWLDELRDIRDYRELGPRLMSLLESVTKDGSTEEWVRRFVEHDVPVAPVRDLDDHLSDPQVAHNRTYGELEDPRLGRVRYARYPVMFSGPENPPVREPSSSPDPFPEVGEDTQTLRKGAEELWS